MFVCEQASYAHRVFRALQRFGFPVQLRHRRIVPLLSKLNESGRLSVGHRSSVISIDHLSKSYRFKASRSPNNRANFSIGDFAIIHDNELL